MGQLKPGDSVRFVRLTPAEAARRLAQQDAEIAALRASSLRRKCRTRSSAPTIASSVSAPRQPTRRASSTATPATPTCWSNTARIVLDLALRFRVHALMQALGKAVESTLPGIVDLTPGIRSLQIHYDAARAARSTICSPRSQSIEDELGDRRRHARCDSRIVHLPLSWDDPATQLAIEKYMRVGARRRALVPEQHRVHPPHQRPRLDRRGAAHRLRRELPGARPGRRLSRRAGGDAARSAPPPGHHQIQPGAHLDAGERRRHRRRLSVHLRHGRARAAISSSAAPCRCGTRYRETGAFEPGKPWLLRFFDQIRFYPVSGEELRDFRDGFLEGKRHIEIIPARFRVRDYLAFVDAYAEKIAAFKTRQQAAFDAERERWRMTPEDGEWRWRIRC